MANFDTVGIQLLIKPCRIFTAHGLVRAAVVSLVFINSIDCGARADSGTDDSLSLVAANAPDRMESTSDNTVAPMAVNSNLIQPVLPDHSEQQKIADEAIHILGGNLNVISQWHDEIRFALIGSDIELARHYALQAFSEISMDIKRATIGVTHDYGNAASYLTSLENMDGFGIYDCAVGDDAQCANFVIVFSGVEMMQNIATTIPLRDVYRKALAREEDVLCFFSPILGRGRVIEGGFVYIRQGMSDAMTRTCLFEEIYQSFGVFNDYTDSAYFSFNNRIEPKDISFYDRALLRALYDPEFTSGTPAFSVVNRLMENLGFVSYWK